MSVNESNESSSRSNYRNKMKSYQRKLMGGIGGADHNSIKGWDA